MSLSKLVIVALSFILLVSNCYAMEKCINDGVVTKLIIGNNSEEKGIECPDAGNCIYFEYFEDEKAGKNYVLYNMNFNDGNKGMAMYDLLKSSLFTGMKIEAWSSINNCKSNYGSSVDVIGLSHHAHQSHHTVID